MAEKSKSEEREQDPLSEEKQALRDKFVEALRARKAQRQRQGQGEGSTAAQAFYAPRAEEEEKTWATFFSAGLAKQKERQADFSKRRLNRLFGMIHALKEQTPIYEDTVGKPELCKDRHATHLPKITITGLFRDYRSSYPERVEFSISESEAVDLAVSLLKLTLGADRPRKPTGRLLLGLHSEEADVRGMIDYLEDRFWGMRAWLLDPQKDASPTKKQQGSMKEQPDSGVVVFALRPAGSLLDEELLGLKEKITNDLTRRDCKGQRLAWVEIEREAPFRVEAKKQAEQYRERRFARAREKLEQLKRMGEEHGLTVETYAVPKRRFAAPPEMIDYTGLVCAKTKQVLRFHPQSDYVPSVLLFPQSRVATFLHSDARYAAGALGGREFFLEVEGSQENHEVIEELHEWFFWLRDEMCMEIPPLVNRSKLFAPTCSLARGFSRLAKEGLSLGEYGDRSGIVNYIQAFAAKHNLIFSDGEDTTVGFGTPCIGIHDEAHRFVDLQWYDTTLLTDTPNGNMLFPLFLYRKSDCLLVETLTKEQRDVGLLQLFQLVRYLDKQGFVFCAGEEDAFDEKEHVFHEGQRPRFTRYPNLPPHNNNM